MKLKYALKTGLTTVILMVFAACSMAADYKHGLSTDDISGDKSQVQANLIIRSWKSPMQDGLHDMRLPAVKVLEDPSGELTALPRAAAGNQVDWVQAVIDGYIYPRDALNIKETGEVLDLDVLLDETGEMPMITFPHKPHTMWLDCKNCHDHIFKRKRGATPHLNMYAVLTGKMCGVCHGAVAFPPTDCLRCHNTPREFETVPHRRSPYSR